MHKTSITIEYMLCLDIGKAFDIIQRDGNMFKYRMYTSVLDKRRLPYTNELLILIPLSLLLLIYM